MVSLGIRPFLLFWSSSVLSGPASQAASFLTGGGLESARQPLIGGDWWVFRVEVLVLAEVAKPPNHQLEETHER